MSNTQFWADEDDHTILKRKILNTTGEFDIESVRYLELSKSGIKKLSAIGECVNMIRLNISHNQISVITPLANLKQLEYLNISSNSITSLDALSSLASLVELNAAGNLIESNTRLKCLSRISALRKLRLRDPVKNLSNPVCSSEKYQATTLDMLPNLLVLDGMTVRGRGSRLFQICSELDAQLQPQSHGQFCPCGKCDGDDDRRDEEPARKFPLTESWIKPEVPPAHELNSDAIESSVRNFNKIVRDSQRLYEVTGNKLGV